MLIFDKKNYYIDGFVISLFFISPVISVPLLIIRSSMGYKYAIVLLCLFIGLLGYVTVPEYYNDLAKYYTKYNIESAYSNKGIYFDLFAREGFVLNILMQVLNVNGLSMQWVPFIVLFLGYYIVFLIYKDIVSGYAGFDLFEQSMLIVLLLSAVDYRGLLLGVRSVFAEILGVYAGYLIFKKSNNKGWLVLLGSCMIHFMMLIYLPLFLFVKSVKSLSVYKALFVISFIFYFLNASITGNVLSYLYSIFPIYEGLDKTYIYGYYAFDYIDEMSENGKIYLIIRSWVVYYILYICLKNIKRDEVFTDIYKLLLISLTLVNVFASYVNLYHRYSVFSILLFLIIFISNVFVSKMRKSDFRKTMYITVLFYMLYSFSGLYSMRELLYSSFSFVFSNNIISIIAYKVIL